MRTNPPGLSIVQRLDPAYDHLSTSQLLVHFAKPQQKEFPTYTVDELANIIDQFVWRRAHFEGREGLYGELDTIIQELLGTKQDLRYLYPQRKRCFSQYDKVDTVIKYLGDELFEKKNLYANLPKDDAETIRSLYEEYKSYQKRTKKDLQAIINNPNKARGILDNMLFDVIDLDVLMQKESGTPKLSAIIIFKKLGKDYTSFAQKIAEYLIKGYKHPYNKGKDASLHVFDPHMVVVYYLKKEEHEEDPYANETFRKLIGTGTPVETRIRADLESILATNKEIEDFNEKHGKTLDRSKERKLAGLTGRYRELSGKLNKAIAASSETVPENDLSAFMGDFYEAVSLVEDVRGVQFVVNDMLKRPYIQSSPHYKGKSTQEHSLEKDKRNYVAEHGKLKSRLLKKADLGRWVKLKEKELTEIQKLSVYGLLQDLLGKDNKARYKRTKARTKYGLDDKRMWRQKTLNEQMEYRLLLFGGPLQVLAFEDLIRYAKDRGTTVDRYEAALYEKAQLLKENYDTIRSRQRAF